MKGDVPGTIAAQLIGGEKVLWWSRPNLGHYLLCQLWIFLLLLPFVVVAIVVIEISGFHDSIVLLYFGVAAIMVMMVSQTLGRGVSEFYAITNRRALVISWFGLSTQPYTLPKQPIDYKHMYFGYCSIVLEAREMHTMLARGGRTRYIKHFGFYSVKDLDYVTSLLLQENSAGNPTSETGKTGRGGRAVEKGKAAFGRRNRR